MSSRPDPICQCVHQALIEDLGAEPVSADGDLTGHIVLGTECRAMARVVAKAGGVLAGVDAARTAFTMLDPRCEVRVERRDGDRVAPGDLVMRIEGPARAVLAAERTALNLLQRLSGVATATRRLVDAVAGTGARILDTRKTTPGMRVLEKAAVVAGGGHNHRMGLFDQVLLKENHFALAAPRSHAEVVEQCVRQQDAPVIAEARSVAEAVAVVRGGAAVVLLDNFAPGPDLRQAVQAVRQAAAVVGRQVEVEASGGVSAGNVRAFAECGVDRISVGSITHSAPALDLSLLVEGA